ncbi:MAG TPA: NAD(P)/FAD-dependent oxidoreductase [Pseudomonadales bacterium]
MSNKKNPSVVVIGAGMTGIAVVIKLRQAGITNVTLLEKAQTVGGTWRENRYPGIACDVPSHAYTYSFEPWPEWNKMFADGSQIFQYFKMVYEKYGVDQCTKLNEGVTSCVYDDNSQQWTVKTTQGNTYVADLLFSATGILHKPAFPDIKGLDTFKGISMHSSQWRDDVDFKNKKIGVIGVGSSAVQLIPELINTAGTEVTVFQRTPQWIVHVDNKVYDDKAKQRFREKPSRMMRVKNISLRIFQQGTTALTGDSWWDKLMHKLFAWNSRRNLAQRVKDPVLREKLMPKYKFGCKRVVMNGTFYDAIQKPNAHLVTEGIECINEQGVVTKDGKTHALDILVLATGFDPAAFMRPMEFTGRNGLSIDQAWEKKIHAYRSLCIPGFPNFFLMLGPNSPIGNYSVIAMSEIQADYCLGLIKAWQAGTLDTIEATPAAVDSWHAMLKSKMGKTVWASGCQSWYLDANGDPLTWPDKWTTWVKLMKDVDLGAFVRGRAGKQKAA